MSHREQCSLKPDDIKSKSTQVTTSSITDELGAWKRWHVFHGVAFYPTVAAWVSVGDRWPIHVGNWGRLMKGLFIGVSLGLRKPKLW